MIMLNVIYLALYSPNYEREINIFLHSVSLSNMS